VTIRSGKAKGHAQAGLKNLQAYAKSVVNSEAYQKPVSVRQHQTARELKTFDCVRTIRHALQLKHSGLHVLREEIMRRLGSHGDNPFRTSREWSVITSARPVHQDRYDTPLLIRRSSGSSHRIRYAVR
jgi:hypothetical protein